VVEVLVPRGGYGLVEKARENNKKMFNMYYSNLSY
jgi:hypothetical protein